MALKGKNFLKLLDFTPAEISEFLSLAADLKAKKKAGIPHRLCEGKNIVKVLLENYGYTVIDLGRDVDPAAVVEAARKYEAPLVGLSALMTTTLKSMAQTIAQLHDAGLPCKIMVGGAVLTPEYAKEISADFYARDAKESVDIAKRVVG